MVGDESAGVFAGYRIEGLIRHGGMASVYRARHLVLHRAAALKVLAPALAGDDRFRARFLAESRTAASLDHPHIVPIYDAGESDGALYIAMRLIEGSDLRTVLETETRLEPRRAVEILGQVAGALDAAHGLGLVHRDVKPSNILISGSAGAEHAYLSDFGITKQLASEGMTATSEFVGTIAYMSPEQIEGLPLDGRADVYALGCVLHECVTGAAPFTADTVVGVMHAHLTKPPPRPTLMVPSLPDGLDAVVATAMAKRPQDRYPTCAALIDAARAALDAPRRAPVVPVFVPSATAAAVAAPAAAGGGTGGRGGPPRVGPAGAWARRWPALVAATAALLLVTVVAAGSLRGSPGNAPPTPGPQAVVPPGGNSRPVPVTGTSPTATPTLASAAPHPATSRPVAAVTVNASTAAPATARATPRPTSNPVHTAGPPSPTAIPTAAPTPAPTAATTPWPGSAPTNSTAGCEPAWGWTCVTPGHCHNVSVYSTNESIASGTRTFSVTVGPDGSLCARWNNPGIEGALVDSTGKTVAGVSGANAGFMVYNLTPGTTYTVSLKHTDPTTSNVFSIQINFA